MVEDVIASDLLRALAAWCEVILSSHKGTEPPTQRHGAAKNPGSAPSHQMPAQCTATSPSTGRSGGVASSADLCGICALGVEKRSSPSIAEAPRTPSYAEVVPLGFDHCVTRPRAL